MLLQVHEKIVQDGAKGFGREASTLVRRGQRNADLHLAAVVLFAVQAAITDHLVAVGAGDGKLEPGAWNVRIMTYLSRYQARSIVGAEGVP
jgi:hypothetical protein